MDIQNRLKKILTNADNCVYVAREIGRIAGWIQGFFSLRINYKFV